MYGTVNEICVELLQSWVPETRMALLVWTEDDVKSVTESYKTTPVEAVRVLEEISLFEDHHRTGVGMNTAQEILCRLREEDGKERSVTVPENALRMIMQLAGAEMERISVCAEEGGGDAALTLAEENEACAQLRAALDA